MSEQEKQDNSVPDLDYPCEVAVKVMGRVEGEQFEQAMMDIIRQHFPDVKEEHCSTRESREGNFVALTVTVMAESKAQMDDLYQDLTDHHLTLYAL